MANYGVYATLEEVKEYLQGTKSAQLAPQDDQRILQFCQQMSRKFDSHCKRRFYPRIETRYYDHPHQKFTPQQRSYGFPTNYAAGSGSPVNSPYPNVSIGYSQVSYLELDDDLLEVISFTTDNGNTAISASDYFLMTGDSYNFPPYDRLQLKADGSQTTLSYSGTPQQANAVNAFWGYHEDWSNAWSQVDTVQDNPLSDSATTLTVSDVDGPDDLGIEPRFKVQQLCRFGTGTDAEYFFVTGKDNDNSQLNIIRGVNGTAAAQQAQDTAIYVYRPMDDIKHAMLVLAAWAYRRKDVVGSDVDQPIASPTGVVIMPSVLPGEVKDMLKTYLRSPNS